jgi:hypothetical protein
MATPHLVRTGPGPGNEPAKPLALRMASRSTGSGEDEVAHARARRANGPAVRGWPLLLLAAPAAVAVWSGWVGIGQLTGFGQVRPLPGIWDSLHIDSAITLPVGVEAYAAYALHAWLDSGAVLTERTRRFAKWSAIGSLLLGMAGQIAYHLLTQAHASRAPWEVTVVVACLPVLILGMAAGLTHMIRADAAVLSTLGGMHAQQREGAASCLNPERVAEAEAAAAELAAAGRRVSRRSLRAAGVHGSNADLGALARMVGMQLASDCPGDRPTDVLPAVTNFAPLTIRPCEHVAR